MNWINVSFCNANYCKEYEDFQRIYTKKKAQSKHVTSSASVQDWYIGLTDQPKPFIMGCIIAAPLETIKVTPA